MRRRTYITLLEKRCFGGVKRKASVLCIDKTEDIIDRAKNGRKSQKACHLSYQFNNLARGLSFVQEQNKKWRHSKTGLRMVEIQILETASHEVMTKLEYLKHTWWGLQPNLLCRVSITLLVFSNY